MTKSEYLSRFSRSVRWRLSYQEAEEVVGDYEDLFAQSGRDEESVCQELGAPAEAARLLGSRLSYFRWLGIFFLLLIPVLALFAQVLGCYLFQSFLGNLPEMRGYTVLGLSFLGVCVCFIWFCPAKGEKRAKIPKGILLTLGVLLLAAAVLTGILACFFHQVYYNQISVSFARAVAICLTVCGGGFAFAGLFGLIRSRICDRRWRSVYILGLSFLVICFFCLEIIVSLDFFPEDRSAFLGLWQFVGEEFKLYGILGCAGLLGAGLALC